MTRTSATSRAYPYPAFVRVIGEGAYVTWDVHVYTWEQWGRVFRLRIPRGFQFDGASVPRIVRPILDRWSLGIWPPLVHDFPYRYRGEMPHGSYQELVGARWLNVREPMTRRTADWVMLDLMRRKDVERDVRLEAAPEDETIPQPIGRVRREAAYQAIRAGGWWAWRNGKRRMTL